MKKFALLSTDADYDEESEFLWILQALNVAEDPRTGLSLHEKVEAFEDQERLAVDLAERGNLAPLIDLLNSNAFDDLEPRPRNRLNERTWNFLLQYLKGKRHKGRPKMTDEKRISSSPVHRAAISVPDIENRLYVVAVANVHRWPSKTPPFEEIENDVRARAIGYAARIFGISPDTLFNYINRPPGDRRRTSS